MRVLVIAEAGVNHNGQLKLAKEMVDRAKEAGVDCIKFQTFIAEQVVAGRADQSQLRLLRQLQLSFADFRLLQAYCQEQGVQFLSTPFDLESIDFLRSLQMKRWKIPSGEITNLPYLMKIAQWQQPVILSTGMCDLAEIEAAVQVLKTNGCGEITLLHCTTQYPAPYEAVNLKAMATMRKKFQLPVGYSDHTPGIEVSLAAVALGATVIEKHFTLDRKMVGPDHQASLEPPELKAMVKAIRHLESALGSGEKKPSVAEKKNRVIARKSIVAKEPIKKGAVFTMDNLTVKRPGSGISPMQWFAVLGQKAARDFAVDELIVL